LTLTDPYPRITTTYGKATPTATTKPSAIAPIPAALPVTC
jgi:hypothetical protein